jgi:hypothetical protein
MNDGLTVFLLETERPLYLSDWAVEHAIKNSRAKTKAAKQSKI